MRGAVVWITGRPSAGKSTLARRLAESLRVRRCACLVLDGDEVRATLVPQKGYSPQDRDDFYATLSHLAVLAARQGLIVIVAATAHKRTYRESCRRAAPRFFEIFVDASPEEVVDRDPKGLYRDAKLGTVTNLPGLDLAYEPPLHPECVASGGEDQEALRRLFELLESAS
ncbi:MAG: adenylyl-sulfate kinase [Deltaproteobacteria bacterium]|nr:adenylyl-sulfate kinase [Deltaproteobacteria bacterium]